MPRLIREACPTRPGNAEAWPATAFETLDLQIQVVTPMFGGGAEAGEPDPVTLIRPSSIRGHLRFWWRATRGAACQTIAKLKSREVEIFGDTEHPSPVIVDVKLGNVSQQQRCGEWNDVGAADDGSRRFRFEWASQFSRDLSSLQYAIFPFQGESPIQRPGDHEPTVKKAPALFVKNVEFHLTLRVMRPLQLNELRRIENARLLRAKKQPLPEKVDDIATDLKVALSAWIAFGGIGGRSRRGCGALQEQLNGDILDPIALAQQFGITIHVATTKKGAVAAWNEVVQTYRDFRQGFRGKPHDKKRGHRVLKNIPGRSHWPEPDSIRRLTGCALPPLPQIPRGALVIIEGRAPIWRYGMAFHRLHGSAAAAIAVYDPRLGAVIVASHHPDFREGQILDVQPPHDDP